MTQPLEDSPSKKIKLSEFEGNFSKIDEILERRIKEGNFGESDDDLPDLLIEEEDLDNKMEEIEWNSTGNTEDLQKFVCFSLGMEGNSEEKGKFGLKNQDQNAFNENLGKGNGKMKEIEGFDFGKFASQMSGSTNQQPVNNLEAIFKSQAEPSIPLLNPLPSPINNFQFLPSNSTKSPPSKVFAHEMFNSFTNNSNNFNLGNTIGNPIEVKKNGGDNEKDHFSKLLNNFRNVNGIDVLPPQENPANFRKKEEKDKINRERAASLKTASPEQMLQNLFSDMEAYSDIRMFSIFQSKFQLEQEKDTWYYKDPLGMIQGPFKSLNMDLWNLDGYFNPMLMISWLQSNQFVTIDHFKSNPASLYKLAMIYIPYPIKFDSAEFEEYKRKESLPIEQPLSQEPIIQPIQAQNSEMNNLFDFMKSNNIQSNSLNSFQNLHENSNLTKTEAKFPDSDAQSSEFNAHEQLSLLAQRFPELSIASSNSNSNPNPNFLPASLPNPQSKSSKHKRKPSQGFQPKQSSSSKGNNLLDQSPNLTASELKSMLGIKPKEKSEDGDFNENVRKNSSKNQKEVELGFNKEEDFPPLY